MVGGQDQITINPFEQNFHFSMYSHKSLCNAVLHVLNLLEQEHMRLSYHRLSM